MSKPFFLTRQTANLMEDFMRELKAGSALFLLYGGTGVGKTRLLQELKQTRLSDARIQWIDLKVDTSAENTVTDRSAEVEAIFEMAASGDIIIVDHFEEGLKKARHQLFLSWSTNGIDKQLNLIIASSTEGFNELRQLSQQYQARVQSFQLMPFNPDEVDAFLGFYLFPDHPIGNLSIAAPLRKQLAATEGVVGGIVEIADRDGAQIKSSPLAETESIRRGSRIIVSVLILFAVAVGVGWYLASRPGVTPAPSTAAIESEPAVMTESAPAAESQMTPEVETSAVVEAEPTGEASSEIEQGVEVTIVSEPVPDAQAEAETSSAVVAEVDSESSSVPEAEVKGETESGAVIKAEVGIETESGPATEAKVASESVPATAAEVEIVTESEPGTVSDTEAVLSPAADSEQVQETTLPGNGTRVVEQSQGPLSNGDRFGRDLVASRQWINKHDDKVGTIQILILGFDTFDAAVYYDFVAHLEKRQVEVDKLHIFKTYTGNKEVYSVFYGEYDNRRAALKAIADLPDVLKDTSPIPRSVGGLWEEIRRLEVEN